MKKETLTNKIIKNFYGITGPFDEQKQQTVNRIGNLAFISLFWLLLIGNLLALTLAEAYPQLMAYAYPIFLEISLLGISLFVWLKVQKSKANEIDPEFQTDKEKKKLQQIGFRSGFLFGLLNYLLLPFIHSFSKNQKLEMDDILQRFFALSHICTAIIGGILFGFFIRLIVRHNLRKTKTEED